METVTAGERQVATGFSSNWILPVLGLAAGWLPVFNVLRADWATNAQYYYGWFVPLLAAGLFRLRWSSRPAPAPALNVVTSISVVALLLVLPIRLIEEANPEWKLIQWTHALQMVLVTFCFLYYVGGWPWVRHFAFPVLFMLVMVPWPVPLEKALVQDLMRVIAAITVELVGVFNIPAVQHGNIIQISAGMVGIDEACSGVRSLQTALFICLFLGELYRFRWSSRVGLILLGLLVALLANLGRTFYLVWVAFHQGMDRMHSVHDMAGQLVMIFTLVGIWMVSQLLRRGQTHMSVSSNSSPAPRCLPVRFAISALVWLIVAELATESWYRLHESKAQANARWSAIWPESPTSSKTIKIDDTVTAMLRYNEGREGVWEDSTGNKWQAFFFRWAAGRNSAQLASAHTPDICLKGAGCKMTQDVGIHTIIVNGLTLPFRQYVFDRGGSPLHVFYCRWEDHVDTHFDTSYDDGSKLSRFRAALAGRRNLGQQVLEAIISGPETPAEGLAALERQLPEMIRQ